MGTPFFSVIISTFNREKLLTRALNSLIEQIENDWEAIVVDDGSTDGTKELIEKILNIDKRFSYFFQENQGVGIAKNCGIESAKGKYVTFLDSDDEYKKEHLSIRKNLLMNHKDLDILHGSVEIIGNQNVPDLNEPNKMISLDDCIIGGTLIIKRSFLKKTEGYPKVKFGDDRIFYESALKHNPRIMEISDKTYIYHRDSEDSLCNNFSKE